MDNNGLSGGMALFWHESCQVTVLGKNDCYIDMVVRTHADGDRSLLVFF